MQCTEFVIQVDFIYHVAYLKSSLNEKLLDHRRLLLLMMMMVKNKRKINNLSFLSLMMTAIENCEDDETEMK
jgi:hypothetical protein